MRQRAIRAASGANVRATLGSQCRSRQRVCNHAVFGWGFWSSVVKGINLMAKVVPVRDQCGQALRTHLFGSLARRRQGNYKFKLVY